MKWRIDMKVFIVATPLFDASMAVMAYRLCDRSGENAIGIHNDFRRMREVFNSPGLDLIEQLGLETFAGDKLLFANINHYQLLVGRPVNVNINPQKLVCTLPASIPADEKVLDRCRRLKDLGYGLALEGLPKQTEDNSLIPLLDYLILDYLDPGFSGWYFTARTELTGLKLVFANVPDGESYQRLAARNPQSLFAGGFYKNPITEGNTKLSPVKINALQLLNRINSEDFELDDVVKIIERDPYLTISLLRFINSAAVGLKRKVDSIRNAVAILGQKEIKRWATIAISISLAEDRPGEITKLTLMRAKFAEGLATAFSLGIFQSSLFMLGLFSLLDVILQKPMEEALKEVAVEERVRRALIQKEGNLYTILDFIYTYERADWDKCSIIMIQNDVKFEAVSRAFLEATLWYHQLLSTLDQP